MSFVQYQYLASGRLGRDRRLPNSRQGLTRPSIDPTLSLDLQFSQDQAYVARRGPLPTFTRASTATYEDSSGTLRTAALNEARIDYDPTTLACLGLLLEESRTNLCPRSEEFSDASWSKYIGTVTANAGVAPDGTSSADLIYPSSSGNITGQLYRAITGIIAGNVVTISFFAKAAGKTICYLSRVTNSSVPDAYFNLSTGAITNVASGMSAQIKQYPNGWWRVSLTSTASAGTQFAWIGSVDSAGAQFNTASGTNGILVWGAQVEVGAFPTSYIPTTSAAVVRAADVCSITGTDFTNLWNQTEGTLILEQQKAYSVPTTISQLTYLSASDGTANNYISFAQRGISPIGEVFRSENGGVGQANFAAGPRNAIGTPFRLGGAYKLNDFASSINGSDCTTDNSGTVPNTLNQLAFTTVTSANHIRAVQYYRVRKTNAQLTKLTELSTLDQTLALDLQFAADATYFSRRGPTPVFTRASSARFVDSDGLIKVASTNVPRIDFHPVTRACLGLLIEEQRTNLTIWSEDATNAAWGKANTTATGNTAVAPDGNSSADTLAETTANSQHYCTTPIGTISSGTTYTTTIFLKKGLGATAPDWVLLVFLAGAFGSKGIAFNVTTGAVGTTLGGQTAQVTQFPNGWWRVSMTATAIASVTTSGLYLAFTNNANIVSTPTYAGQTTSDILVWGAQFEVGFGPTSYIPTSGSAVTRSADVCSITGSDFTRIFNPPEGTVVVKHVRATNAVSCTMLALDDTTATERMINVFSSGVERFSTVDGATTSNLDRTAGAINTPIGYAARYRNLDFAFSVTGSAVVASTTQTVPTVTQMTLGQRLGSNYLNGHIQSVRYLTSGKNNAELQTLSA